MKHVYFLVTFFAAFITTSTEAQVADKKSVVIGTMDSHPNALLILNPPLKNQGVLLPKLTKEERQENLKPTSPGDDGLIVFDSDDNTFYYWKSGQWHTGLGTDGENQKLSYDAATQRLTLNLSGGEIDLSPLKEIPAVSGNAGKYISTNGTNVVWSTLPANDNIKNIVPGQGLSGGGSTSTVNLALKTDNITVGVNGSDALEIKNAGVTTLKIADQSVTPVKILPGISKQVLTTDATGKVAWSTPTAVTDNQTLSFTGNSLSITNGNSINIMAAGQVAGPIHNLSIANGTVAEVNLAPNAVTSAKIANDAVTPAKILSGGNDKVLTTSPTGVVTWTNRSAFPSDTQTLSLTGNSLSITNGNSINITAAGQVAGPIHNLSITDGTVTAADLAAEAVNTTKILSGGNDKVLTTSPTGVVTWTNRSAFPSDTQTLSLTGNSLSITNGNSINITAAGQIAGPIHNLSIANGTVAEVNLAPNAVTSAKIANDAVTPAKILSGGNDKVLTTSPTGVVAWSDRSSFTDDNQNLALAGNTLNIDNGSSVNLNSVTAGGQITGPLNNLVISNNTISAASIIDNTINTADLANGAVTTLKIQPGANNQVLTTTGGVATWAAMPGAIDGSVTNETITGVSLAANTLSITEAAATFNQSLNGLALTGDVTGNLNTNKVTKIQNNPIDPAVLSVGDNGKIMVWNGTQWSPTAIAGLTTSDQYYAIDPSDFQSVRNGSQKDKDNIIIFEENNTFVTVFKKDEARNIIAPIHLPDGVTMDQVTVFYMDDASGSINVKVFSKTFLGVKTQLGTWTSSINNSSINTANVSITSQQIDNSLNSYRIEISLAPEQDINSPDDASHRIYGIRVRYKQ